MNSLYNRQNILQNLSNTLQNMLHHAHRNEWDEVTHYNKLRSSLSSQLQPITHKCDPAEKQLIEELCRIDLAIVDLAKKARDEAADSMSNISGRKSNVNQYLQHQFS